MQRFFTKFFNNLNFLTIFKALKRSVIETLSIALSQKFPIGPYTLNLITSLSVLSKRYLEKVYDK